MLVNSFRCVIPSVGLFYFDKDLISRNIDKADTLLAEGGDWDR